VETRRLRLLLELARLGSMRAVAEELHTTTSAVSQQLAVLAREAGTALVEPAGRRVRLTPAGRRLAEHAVTILAAVDAARRDLDPAVEPAGTVRVAGFATAVRRSLLPAVADLADRHPRVRLLIGEHEPAEAIALLAADEVDLALTYDYNLAPAPVDRSLDVTPLWSAAWSLAVPAQDPAGDAPALIARYRAHDWIVNSRNTADEDVARTLASLAGSTLRITHRADNLDLVQDLITAGLGVALLPADQPVRAGVRLLALTGPEVVMRAYALTRRGSGSWAPLALVVRLLTAEAAVGARGSVTTVPSAAGCTA
jgi:DNA-binding transcriptional LysR family regulator